MRSNENSDLQEATGIVVEVVRVRLHIYTFSYVLYFSII